MALQTLTIRRPDDWHVHLRDGEMLKTRRALHRAAVRAGDRHAQPGAADHHRRSGAAPIASGSSPPPAPGFTPLMTCYLTDDADPGRDRARASRTACGSRPSSIRPARPPTARSGVTDIRNIYPALERMEQIGMVLCVHGEVTDPDVDVFDREAVFIERVLIARRPRLSRAEDRVRAHHDRRGGRVRRAIGPNVAATVTPQHLIINRNAIFAGGLRPHAYCLPVAKREEHRLAVRKAATSGSPKFFLGTDSAPHAREAKEIALRLRRHLQRAVRARKLCDRVRGGRRARPVRGVRVGERRRASTGCRSTRGP